jgi:hypothetical protein
MAFAAGGGAGAAGVGHEAAAPGRDAATPHPFPLIGLEGAKFVSETLASRPPQSAIRVIQAAAGLGGGQQAQLCAALLGLVDQLGYSRHDAHRAALLAAKHATLAQVRACPALCAVFQTAALAWRLDS